MSGNSIVADTTPPKQVQRVHPGGYFWSVQRADRLAHVVNFVAQTPRLAIVADSDREVEQLSERLRLSGVPVFQALANDDAAALEPFANDTGSTLIANHDFLMQNGPISVSMAVHLRTARSVREYSKRLDCVQAAVHLTFVVPEDERRATSLQSHLEHDKGHGGPAEVPVTDLIDLTVSDNVAVAAISNQRRRFPLGR